MFQSGFRKNRSTIDNLFFFTQKAYEAFEKGEKTLAIVFDIMKAFDKMWHKGLIYKMHNVKIPKKIGKWIEEFLNDRKFIIKINNTKSRKFAITDGVPQGAILSPILFSIFINDIIEINKYPNEKITSLLFADDLLAFNSYKSMNILKTQMQRYLDDLTKWLRKWRMKMAVNKCSFTIYGKGNTPKEIREKKFKLNLQEEEITINHEPTYLGVILDRNLNFNRHIEKIRENGIKALNILKNLSYKKWSLDTNQKINIYKSLIRSKFEYAPQLLTQSKKINRLQGIQYQALKIIYNKKDYIENEFQIHSSREMHKESNLDKIDIRLNMLSQKYLQKNITNNNELIRKLIDEFDDKLLENPFKTIAPNLFKPTTHNQSVINTQ